LWRSILLVEETGIPGENHRPVTSNWQTVSHNDISSRHYMNGVRTHNLSGDCCKFNYHSITTTMDPISDWYTQLFLLNWEESNYALVFEFWCFL
jgi:hypothetical protein